MDESVRLISDQLERLQISLERQLGGISNRLDSMEENGAILKNQFGAMDDQLGVIARRLALMEERTAVMEKQVGAFVKAPSIPVRRVGYYSGVETQSVSGSSLIRQGRF